jgi:hypothetical protein
MTRREFEQQPVEYYNKRVPPLKAYVQSVKMNKDNYWWTGHIREVRRMLLMELSRGNFELISTSGFAGISVQYSTQATVLSSLKAFQYFSDMTDKTDKPSEALKQAYDAALMKQSKRLANAGKIAAAIANGRETEESIAKKKLVKRFYDSVTPMTVDEFLLFMGQNYITILRDHNLDGPSGIRIHSVYDSHVIFTTKDGACLIVDDSAALLNELSTKKTDFRASYKSSVYTGVCHRCGKTSIILNPRDDMEYRCPDDGELLNDSEYEPIHNVWSVVIPPHQRHFGAKALYESALMNYLDGVLWKSSDLFQAVASSYDLRWAQNIMSRYTYKLVALPAGLSKLEIEAISDNVIGVDVVGISTWQVNAPQIVAALQLSTVLFALNNAYGLHLYFSHHVRTNFLRYKHSMDVAVDKTKDNNYVITDLDSLTMMGLEKILSTSSVFHQIVGLDGYCDSIKYQDHVDLYVPGQPSSLERDAAAYAALDGDVLMYDTFGFVRHLVAKVGDVKYYSWVKTRRVLAMVKDVKLIDQPENMAFNLPWLKPESLLNIWQPLVFEEREITLNRRLIQNLMTRQMRAGATLQLYRLWNRFGSQHLLQV